MLVLKAETVCGTVAEVGVNARQKGVAMRFIVFVLVVCILCVGCTHAYGQCPGGKCPVAQKPTMPAPTQKAEVTKEGGYCVDVAVRGVRVQCGRILQCPLQGTCPQATCQLQPQRVHALGGCVTVRAPRCTVRVRRGWRCR